MDCGPKSTAALRPRVSRTHEERLLWGKEKGFREELSLSPDGGEGLGADSLEGSLVAHGDVVHRHRVVAVRRLRAAPPAAL